MSVDSPGHADFPAPAFSLANGPIVYAVAWIHHNANEAWGADDRLHGISVHASTAHASSHAHRHFKTAFGDKDPMLADGNNFYYPTGANCGFEVFKIQIPQKFYEDLARRSNSNMDTQLHDGYVESDPDDALWRTVFNACLTPLETTRVTVLALLPKPITDMPWRHYPPEGAAPVMPATVEPVIAEERAVAHDDPILLESIGFLKRRPPTASDGETSWPAPDKPTFTRLHP